MKAALITISDSQVNFLPNLKKYLAGQIANIEVTETTLDSILDLPKKLAEIKADLVFVSYHYTQDSSPLKASLGKLLDFELSSPSKVVKAIEKIDPEDFDATEQALAEKYGKIIVKKLIGVTPK